MEAQKLSQQATEIQQLKAELGVLKEVPMDSWLGRVPIDFGSDISMWDSGVPSGHRHSPSDTGSFGVYDAADFEGDGSRVVEEAVVKGDAALAKGKYRAVTIGPPLVGGEVLERISVPMDSVELVAEAQRRRAMAEEELGRPLVEDVVELSDGE